jgi:8-oxo-dGTP diphosphatase
MAVLTTPEAAVAILRARERDSFLLMRRSEHPHDPWSGHWSFPGCRREQSDPDLRFTALRELAEECSIHLPPDALESELAPVIARRRTPPFMVVAPFVFAIENQLPTVLDPEEAVEAVWVPTADWRTPEKHKLTNVPGMPASWLFPALELNGVPVWGFTYRLAMDWLGLVSNDGGLASAGLSAATAVLDLFVSKGLVVKDGLKIADAELPTTEIQPRATATVSGVIPVEQTIEHLSRPGSSFPSVSAIEVQRNHVRVVGLEFEEYLITAS